MKIIFESYRLGLFQRKHWLPNITAGIMVAFVALPLAMAFAIASGVDPKQGLITSMVAGFIVSVFGGSRVQIAGPTGAFIVVLLAITERYGIDGLQIATIIAGFMLMFLGFARFGGVIKFIPYPVIVGFTSGIAVAIFFGQWPYFFGLSAIKSGHFHEKLWILFNNLHHLDPITTFFGFSALLLIVFGQKISFLKRIPGPFLALVAGTVLQTIFHFESVATIGSAFGGIPQGLPAFQIPAISIDRVLELIAPAFTIALLGAIESLLSAVVADGMAGTRHDSNQELIGQGLANIFTPLFGGFAATGAIARTATSIRLGANSPLAGITHVLVLALILIYLAPLAMNIPLCVLAAILFMVAFNMSEWKHFLKIVRVAPRADVLVLWVTFILTIFVDLVVAVNIGVILAIMNFVLRISNSFVIKQRTHQELAREFPLFDLSRLPAKVFIYDVEGPFFFGAVELFEKAFDDTDRNIRVLIIRLRWVPVIDISGIHVFENIIRDFQRSGVKIYLCGANASVMKKLRKAGIIKLLGKTHVFGDLMDALKTIES